MALVVALAATMPLGVRAMSMPAADMNGNNTIQQPCQNCPQPDQTGNTTLDKMPCQVFLCVGSAVLLPASVIAHSRVLFQVKYLGNPPAHWAEAAPAPDPFPPKPIVLL
jgi:hypothetical protein